MTKRTTLSNVYLGTFFGVILSHFDYVEFAVREAIKLIMNYIYFPSPVVYFFIVVFMIINNVYTLFKDMGMFKKIFNYVCSFIIFLLFKPLPSTTTAMITTNNTAAIIASNFLLIPPPFLPFIAGAAPVRLVPQIAQKFA